MKTLATSSAPHPQVEIVSVDPLAGVVVFAWLDADGARVDSGGSIARFTPSEDGSDPDDATLVDAITNPPPIVAAVPASVGSGQIRAAMIASGLGADDAALDSLINGALTAAVADPTQRAIALALWGYASEFRRDNAFIATARAALGMTDAQIDDLFRLAATF